MSGIRRTEIVLIALVPITLLAIAVPALLGGRDGSPRATLAPTPFHPGSTIPPAATPAVVRDPCGAGRPTLEQLPNRPIDLSTILPDAVVPQAGLVAFVDDVDGPATGAHDRYLWVAGGADQMTWPIASIHGQDLQAGVAARPLAWSRDGGMLLVETGHASGIAPERNCSDLWLVGTSDPLVQRLTDNGPRELVVTAALAADGSEVAYIEQRPAPGGADPWALMVVSPGGQPRVLDPRPCGDAAPETALVWSPDNRWIAARCPGLVSVYPAAGGAPRLITPPVGYPDVAAVGWSPDSASVLLAATPESPDGATIATVNLATGKVVATTTFGSGTRWQSAFPDPAFSSDAEALVALVRILRRRTATPRSDAGWSAWTAASRSWSSGRINSPYPHPSAGTAATIRLSPRSDEATERIWSTSSRQVNARSSDASRRSTSCGVLYRSRSPRADPASHTWPRMEFRPLALEDRTAWARLLAVCFDRTPEQMERLLAWFHDGFELVTWSAWDGDRLVAQYNCRLLDLEIPGYDKPVPAGMGLNMAVDPGYRGQGLLEQVASPVHEIIGARGCTAGVGFSSAGGLAVTRSSRSYAYDVLGPMASIVVPLVRRRYPEPLRLTDSWPDEPVALQQVNDGLVRYHVTPASLRHRFGSHPFRHYEFGLWRENDSLEGLVVFRRTRIRGVRAASLLAAYAVDLPGVLAGWAGALRSTGVHFVHVLVSPASPIRDALRAIGPRWSAPVSRNPYHLIVRPLQPNTPPQLGDLQAWDCAGGDIL